MKKYLLLLMLLWVKAAVAQSSRMTFNECLNTSSCLDCGDTRARYKSDNPNELTKYFRGQIYKSSVQTVKGYLMVQVIVDTAGKPCAKSITNLTNVSNYFITKLGINAIVKEMPKWNAAVEKGKKRFSSVMVKLSFLNAGDIMTEYTSPEAANKK